MNGKSSATKEIFTCPACGDGVFGTLAIDLTLGEIHEKSVDANVTVTGLQVSHDCTPRLTRGNR